ncbi:rhamnosyltransferase WsaF family glycosyltransferase [Microbacterium caowuchunii]|uniref:Glycosyltransferase family 4 protein n=1 Tax=Microbacterium caowuchunii TaxID=2614638 RepID=A0A5N0TKK6_9MICO|nr:glycosyltransferase family 4 protein [Microbacterium caowuchunii]KAA9135532.1 glycosyltransferase family 4 protein [Microbacterium caowuchunii]
MMEAARVAGFTNTLLFYDRYRSDHAHNTEVIRSAWPWLECEVEPVGETLIGFDGVIASSWPTAHVAARRRLPGQPVIYFVQDFEPYFYPRGSEYAIAQDSYRLGHRNVSLGAMVRDTLAAELSVESDYVPFGCDTDVYGLRAPTIPRSGVVFYAKRGNDRRGHRLAVLALSEFHRRHPDQPIHTYGDAPRDLPFPVIDHGGLPPARLNELYNSVIAGVAMSFTNISLVAEEMLAAGVVPVVNDSPLARADLANPHVAWADPTPLGIADALSAAVTQPALDARARAVSASVATAGWAETGRLFAGVIAEELDPLTGTAGNDLPRSREKGSDHAR